MVRLTAYVYTVNKKCQARRRSIKTVAKRNAAKGNQGIWIRAVRRAEMKMHGIDLIDWTWMRDQPRLDHAKPHLQFLFLSGVQISLDTLPGGDPQI
jgi:hypothetical protein